MILKRFWMVGTGLAILFLMFVGSFKYMNWQGETSLPAVEYLDSVRVIDLYDGLGRKSGPFELPSAQWADCFAALRPTSLDMQPAKWEIMGILELRTKKGPRLKVDLYKTSAPYAAYSAGPWPTDEGTDRRYYRAESQSRLVTEIKRLWKKMNTGMDQAIPFDVETLADTEAETSKKMHSKPLGQ